MLSRLKTFFKHRWLDAADARRVLPPDMVQRLLQGVAASERRHTGEVRICVEAGLPLSYLWRHVRGGPSVSTLRHQRAVMLFGKLRIWDTEYNNGVLIYLLLAERAIEVVADRGLSRRVSAQQWQALVAQLGTALQQDRFELGLTQALEEVSALLEQHFPLPAGASRVNELPNAPVLI